MDLEPLTLYLSDYQYPEPVIAVTHRLQGWGSYPAANGFDKGTSPLGGIMLLGRDWGSTRDYEKFIKSLTQDETGGSSKRTRNIFMPGFQKYGVWRTNYLLGLRVKPPSTGNIENRFFADDWISYERKAWDFLQEQVLVQQPQVIVVLGKHNLKDLSTPERFRNHDLGDFFTHTFVNSTNNKHTAKITFADHPYSWMSKYILPRFRRKMEQIEMFIKNNSID